MVLSGKFRHRPVFFFNYRLDENDLEVLTCTDLEQRWGQLKERTLSQFEPALLVDFCCVSPYKSPYRREVKEVDDSMASRFRNMFLQGVYPASFIYCQSFFFFVQTKHMMMSFAYIFCTRYSLSLYELPFN